MRSLALVMAFEDSLLELVCYALLAPTTSCLWEKLVDAYCHAREAEEAIGQSKCHIKERVSLSLPISGRELTARAEPELAHKLGVPIATTLAGDCVYTERISEASSSSRAGKDAGIASAGCARLTLQVPNPKKSQVPEISEESSRSSLAAEMWNRSEVCKVMRDGCVASSASSSASSSLLGESEGAEYAARRSVDIARPDSVSPSTSSCAPTRHVSHQSWHAAADAHAAPGEASLHVSGTRDVETAPRDTMYEFDALSREISARICEFDSRIRSLSTVMQEDEAKQRLESREPAARREWQIPSYPAYVGREALRGHRGESTCTSGDDGGDSFFLTAFRGGAMHCHGSVQAHEASFVQAQEGRSQSPEDLECEGDMQHVTSSIVSLLMQATESESSMQSTRPYASDWDNNDAASGRDSHHSYHEHGDQARLADTSAMYTRHSTAHRRWTHPVFNTVNVNPCRSPAAGAPAYHLHVEGEPGATANRTGVMTRVLLSGSQAPDLRHMPEQLPLPALWSASGGGHCVSRSYDGDALITSPGDSGNDSGGEADAADADGDWDMPISEETADLAQLAIATCALGSIWNGQQA